MSAFDWGLPAVFEGTDEAKRQQSKELSAAIQNGKGDWFNNVIAYLLEQCSGIETLYVRRSVPGLIIPEHNLDGVYPGDETREIEFLLEAKMMGTPKHANSPGEKPAGRAGSMDTNKRVKELAFKSIDLKGEAARRLTMVGTAPTSGEPAEAICRRGCTQPSSHLLLHGRARPRRHRLRCGRPVGRDRGPGGRCGRPLLLRAHAGIVHHLPPPSGTPTAYELERVLYRACTELQGLRTHLRRPSRMMWSRARQTRAEQLTERVTRSD